MMHIWLQISASNQISMTIVMNISILFQQCVYGYITYFLPCKGRYFEISSSAFVYINGFFFLYLNYTLNVFFCEAEGRGKQDLSIFTQGISRLDKKHLHFYSVLIQLWIRATECSGSWKHLKHVILEPIHSTVTTLKQNQKKRNLHLLKSHNNSLISHDSRKSTIGSCKEVILKLHYNNITLSTNINKRIMI